MLGYFINLRYNKKFREYFPQFFFLKTNKYRRTRKLLFLNLNDLKPSKGNKSVYVLEF